MTRAIEQQKTEIFLSHLARTGQISESARAAHLDRSRLYKKRKEDPDFNERWIGAETDYVESLEGAAHLRAVEGVDEPVWYLGQQVGAVRKYSDSLLTTLLKGRMPSRYRDNATVDIGNKPGETLAIEESPTAAARKIAFALAVGLRAAQDQTNATSDESTPAMGLSDGEDLV